MSSFLYPATQVQQSGGGGPFVLAMEFTPSVNVTLSTIYYWKTAADVVANRVATVYQTTGQVNLGGGTFSGETTSGWQTLSITAINLVAGTAYRVVIQSSNSNGFNGSFAGASIAGMATMSSTGYYLAATTGFPTTAAPTTWYGADVSLTATAPSTKLDFPNNPTANMLYNAPNGVTYQWDGAAWIITGGGASGATPIGPAGGDLQGTYPNPTIIPSHLPWTPSGTALVPTNTANNAVQMGSRTTKERLLAAATADASYLTMNATLNAGETAWVQDDATKSSWLARLSLAADSFQVFRSPAGSPPVSLLTIDNNGRLNLSPSGGVDLVAGSSGAAANKMHLIHTNGTVSLRENAGWGSVLPDDSTLPSWAINLGNDVFAVYRAPASASTPAWVQFLGINNAGQTTLTLAPGQVTQAMTAAGAAVRNAVSASFPASYGNTTSNAWITVCTTAAISVRGGWCFIFVSSGAHVNSVGTGTVYHGWARDGSMVGYWRMDFAGASGTGYFPVPGFAYWDNPAAGTHTWSYCIYQTNYGAANWATFADAPGILGVFEMS